MSVVENERTVVRAGEERALQRRDASLLSLPQRQRFVVLNNVGSFLQRPPPVVVARIVEYRSKGLTRSRLELTSPEVEPAMPGGSVDAVHGQVQAVRGTLRVEVNETVNLPGKVVGWKHHEDVLAKENGTQ